ncbi:MAG: hypothetical protein E7228_05240 [Clostridiales bacterium]|nr:hypothetical protein [Clostridiales bacterium]
MTEKKLKDILEIEEWSEINHPEQFLKLMNYYYELAPGVKSKIIAKIPDINGMAEKFKQYCAEGIVEYEPSIMMIVTRLVDDIKKAVGSKNVIRGPESREKISYLYNAFSEWFGLYGEVQCCIGERDFVCNIAEAIELAHENEENEDKSQLKMMLLTKERVDLIERQEARLLEGLDVDLDFITELLGGEEPKVQLVDRKTKKYIM